MNSLDLVELFASVSLHAIDNRSFRTLVGNTSFSNGCYMCVLLFLSALDQ